MLERRMRGEGSVGSAPPGIPRRASNDPSPLSFAQQRLWFLDRLEPDNPFYNVSTAVRMAGIINPRVIEITFGEISRRHEVLRTIFLIKDGQPFQVVSPTAGQELILVDLTGLSGNVRVSETKRLAIEEAHWPFKLSSGPMFRTTLLQLDQDENALLLTMHHVIADGWSVGILMRELSVLYRAFVSGNPSPLPELPIQYVDYALWQKQWLSGEVLNEQLEYWRTILEDAPSGLQIPTGLPRRAVQRFRGATQSVWVPYSLSDALRRVSLAEGVTVFMALLVVFKTVLYRYSGQEDIVVGTGIANRNQPEIEGLIGFFVNMLAIRSNFSGKPSFRTMLRRVQEVTLGAYAHQDLPFERIVQELQPIRDLSRTPIFQIAFFLQNAPMTGPDLPGLALTPLALERKSTHFDLTMYVMETEAGLLVSLEYDTDLLDASTIGQFLHHYKTVLESVVSDQDQPLIRISLQENQARAVAVNLPGVLTIEEVGEFDFQ